MKCSDVKREIALHLGNDPCEPLALKEVRRHLTVCPDCRRSYKGLKVSQAVIEQSQGEESYEQTSSIWPAVRERVNQPRRRYAEYFRAEVVPVTSLVAASILFLVVYFSPPSPPGQHRMRELNFERQFIPGSLFGFEWEAPAKRDPTGIISRRETQLDELAAPLESLHTDE